MLPGVTAFSSIENVRGTSGDDTFTGAPPPNTITGFEGGPGNDVLNGAEIFSETFAGGEGADTLRGGVGGDAFTGGPGNDTVAYDEPSRTAAVTVTLTAGATTGGDGDLLVDEIENATGGSGDDVLVGNAGPTSWSGGAGKDTVQRRRCIGGAQNDTVAGGPAATRCCSARATIPSPRTRARRTSSTARRAPIRASSTRSTR